MAGNDDRFAVRNHDSTFAQRDEVADGRTPLSALMEGEEHERVEMSRSIEASVERVLDQVYEGLFSEVVMTIPREDLRELLVDAIAVEVHGTRLSTIRTFLRYLWSGARNPWEAMKKLLVVTRLVAGDLIRGVSQAEVAWVLGEKKGTTRAREKVFEGLLQTWGVKGFLLTGGAKNDEARKVYQKIRKGNRSRKTGERRKRSQRAKERAAGAGKVGEAAQGHSGTVAQGHSDTAAQGAGAKKMTTMGAERT